jgi:hypothetical protein
MARGKGKRGCGRGAGKRFAAQSAEEIEQRNERLAEFDAKRAEHRAEAAEEAAGGEAGAGAGDAAAEREAMMVGQRVAAMSTEDDDNGGDWKERKSKGLEGIIEVENSNRAPGGGTNARMLKAKDLGAAAVPETRKEREEREKEAKAEAYRKRHAAGLTEEYKRDMAKLNEVKARRDAANARAQMEKEMEEAAEEDRKQKAEAAIAAMSVVDFDGEEKKKKSSKKKGSKNEIPKLDKITIKKMKPAALKEALKERSLDIQGNAKALTERLLTYEKER